MTGRPLRVVAIVAAYNEADVIRFTVSDLIAQGVEVYLLDDGSTDGTADAVRDLLGRGVLAIEAVGPAGDEARAFRLGRILERKQELAAALEADWFINHDADELRETPWLGVDLAGGLREVDSLGWNAVDFELLNFWPTDSGEPEGADLRSALRFYERGVERDRPQVRCWKKQVRVDLISTGGHEAIFPGRRVFPLRFLLRHYPIRSQAHGERKIFGERQGHFDADEVARGWHRQYAEVERGQSFVRDPSHLTAFDEVAVRRRLVPRPEELAALDLERVELEREKERLRRERDAASAARDDSRREADRLRQDLAGTLTQLRALRDSKIWRWTAPLRRLADRLGLRQPSSRSR